MKFIINELQTILLLAAIIFTIITAFFIGFIWGMVAISFFLFCLAFLVNRAKKGGD